MPVRRDRCLHRSARVLGVVVAVATGSADAATFTVTTTADDGAGSLRQAIVAANAAVGADTIAFGIAGPGPHAIALSSSLPGISGTLVIDGYSQPGSLPNTRTPDQGGLDTQLAIEVIGTGSAGFWLQASGSDLTVQGLALRGFSDAIAGMNSGVDASQLRVYGNFIGTRLDGTALPGNGNQGSGVRGGFTATRVGGAESWQRNLLSGNGGAAVYANGPVIIEGNLIGTDASGATAIPNGMATNWPGLLIGSRSAVRIGGGTAASRNVISGNRTWGIGVWYSFGPGGAVSTFEIKGNFIGTDASGLAPVPNGFAEPTAAQFGGGIQIQHSGGSSAAIPIGGFDPGEGNLIAWNRGAGVASSSDNTAEVFDLRGNRIHHNRGVGRVNVDIGAPGPTPNDPGDDDGGANGGQNWPEVISAVRTGNELTIGYRVDTDVANAAWPLRVDFHENRRGGAGPWLGSDSYPSASAGQVRLVTFLLPPGTRAPPLVAIATDAAGRSSEISPAFGVLFEDDFD